MGVVALGPEEAAEWIGVGRTTVYRVIDAGELSVVHVGRKVFIPIEALEAYRERKLTSLARRSQPQKS